jgi:hypothetical protein
MYQPFIQRTVNKLNWFTEACADITPNMLHHMSEWIEQGLKGVYTATAISHILNVA